MLSSVSMRAGQRGTKETTQTEKHEIISMYTEAPMEELTLDEFELFALDRLMVLRKIEDLKARGCYGSEFKDRMRECIQKYMPMKTLQAEDTRAALRKDNISHFILRLAYCRTEELRRWYLTQECALFKYRLEELSPQQMSKFIQENGLAFKMLDAKEKLEKKPCLLSVPGAPLVDFERAVYYKVPFWQATDLVGRREVFLAGGLAYVPIQKVLSIVVGKFRTALSRSLAEASNAFAFVASDSRFGPLLQNMNRQYVGKDYSAAGATGDAITPDQLDMLADRSMPLCMRQLHVSLRREHRLKHWGRLQYGLYLKGAGLGVEDAMAFFRSEFTKVMALDAFEKQYAYGVRHMHGKEGKRTNYTPYSCMKIIMGNPPGPGEHHGCPYRHYDEQHLSALLGQLRLGTDDKEAMMKHTRTKNYQLACQRHFEAIHPGVKEAGINMEGVGNHANAWTHASMEYYKAKSGTAASGSQASDAATVSQGTPPTQPPEPTPSADVDEYDMYD